MPYIGSRSARIIPSESNDGATDEAFGAHGRGRRFDYAALLKQRRAPHRLASFAHARGSGQLGSNAQNDGGEEDAASAALARSEAGNAAALAHALQVLQVPEPTPTEAVDETTESPAHLAPRARVPRRTVRPARAIQHRHYIRLFRHLAREIVGFCADPAIAEGGNWEVQMVLDPKLLPRTTLYLTLSRFSLQLRFDAPETAAKQLLLDNSASLEQELDTLLRAWGQARDIELTVW
jgi:type III secretion control protein HpaP